MLRLAISLISLAGCHVVFGLADPPPDTRGRDVADPAGDASIIDVPRGDSTTISDGRVCWNPAYDDDEDGDTVLDGCDNCPAVANFDQANTDNDDLGDVCDPHPSHVDRIALWHNFKSSIDSGWVPVEGAGVWVHDAVDGAYSQTDGAPGATVAAFGGRTFTKATVEVLISGIRSPINLNTATAGVYLWTDKSPPTLLVPDGVLCMERRPNSDPGNDIPQIIERDSNATVSTTSGVTILGSRAAATYIRVSSDHDGQVGMVACALGRGTNVPAITVSSDPSGTGFVALGTGNTSAEFRSVLVSELVP